MAYQKSALNIQGVNGPNGTLVDRTYDHADHQKIYDCFDEWAQAGLCDFGVTWNDSLSRFMSVFAPRLGTTYTNKKLEIDGALKSVPAIEEDGEKTVTSPIVQGEGSGPERDEGGAVDTSHTNALVLEEVYQQRSGGYYDQLTLQAQETLLNTKAAWPVPEMVAKSIIRGQLIVGDVLPVYVPAAGLYQNVRITSMELDLMTDDVSLTVQPA